LNITLLQLRLGDHAGGANQPTVQEGSDERGDDRSLDADDLLGTGGPAVFHPSKEASPL
jgi:hypothetical protein